MKRKQIRSDRKVPIKIVLQFKSGVEIPLEEFNPQSLTAEQNTYIVKAFEKVFTKK